MTESLWVKLNEFSEVDHKSLHDAYRNASPYPHLVVEELFSREILQEIAKEFGSPSSFHWHEFQTPLQSKRGTAPNTNLPPKVQDYFNFLHSGPFIRFLSNITEIKNLIPDPELHGGGMHEVDAGGHFQVHVDFLKHPRTGLRNRLAVITYLNEDWKEEDGGALELWELSPPRSIVKVLPTFARTVIMEQSERAAHGHPTPVREGRKRRAIIAYFYTAETASEGGTAALPTTYVPHHGYSRLQQAELHLRRIAPRFLIDTIKNVHKAIRTRTSTSK